MLPADQCLGADGRFGAQVDLGLVIAQEFARNQGAADAVQTFMLTADAMILFDVEDMVTILAGPLGQIHGLVSLA